MAAKTTIPMSPTGRSDAGTPARKTSRHDTARLQSLPARRAPGSAHLSHMCRATVIAASPSSRHAAPPARRFPTRASWPARLTALALLACGSAPALADALIVDSTSADVEVGMWLRDGDTVSATNALDLTVLEQGNLRVIPVPAGGFTYRDPAGAQGAGDSARLAMIVSSLIAPDEGAFHVGATRGGKRQDEPCPAPDAVAPQALGDVMVLSDRRCDEAARAALRVLIVQAKEQSPNTGE